MIAAVPIAAIFALFVCYFCVNTHTHIPSLSQHTISIAVAVTTTVTVAVAINTANNTITRPFPCTSVHFTSRVSVVVSRYLSLFALLLAMLLTLLLLVPRVRYLILLLIVVKSP